MPLTPEQRRAIEQRDTQLRQAREAEELIQLAEQFYPGIADERVAEGVMVVRADARAMGAVTALTTRAHQSSWTVPGRPRQLRGRVRGYAGSVENGLASHEPDTVLVRYADNSHAPVVRDVASFRERSAATKVRQTTAARLPETARMGITHDLTGD